MLKDIKNYVKSDDAEPTEDLKNLISFLRDIIEFCQSNLYVDKPIEAALPLFEILRMIQDLFGSQNYQIKVTQILPALYLLEKEDLLQSPELL